MTGRVDVSLVLPTYQGGAHLEACLASVAQQELDGTEVVVVDDGSTDATLDVAQSFAPRLPGLRIEHNARRLGPAANMNRGITLARGSWVKPLGQDDLLDPDCLARLRRARRSDSSVVVCGRRYLFEGDVEPGRRDACEAVMGHALVAEASGPRVTSEELADAVVALVRADRPQVNLVGEPVTMLLRRDAVVAAGGFDTGYVQLWDYELPLRLGLRSGVEVIPEPLATFRIHRASATSGNFAEQGFRTAHLDPLRLLVAWATAAEHRLLRRRARAGRPPVALDVKAMTWATNARRSADELPSAPERTAALAEVDRVADALPWRRRAARHRVGQVIRSVGRIGGVGAGPP